MIALLFVASARLVSLSPTVTEIVCALGACDELVGVTRFDDYPPQVKQLPKVGGYADPSFEATVRLKPDLVLLNKNGSNQAFTGALDKAHIRWLALSDATLSDFAPMTRAIAQALGRPEAAEPLVLAFSQGLERLRGALAGKSAVIVYGHRPLVISGPRTFGSELLAVAGGVNAYSGPQSYPSLDLEALLALRPALIIDVDMLAGGADEAFYAPVRGLLGKRDVRLLFAPEPALMRLGPRLPEAMAALVRRL